MADRPNPEAIKDMLRFLSAVVDLPNTISNDRWIVNIEAINMICTFLQIEKQLRD